MQGLATAGDVNGDGYDDIILMNGSSAYQLPRRLGRPRDDLERDAFRHGAEQRRTRRGVQISASAM